MQDWYHEPDVLIDITPVIDLKMKAIEAYATQFYTGSTNPDDPEPQTYISTPDFRESILARSRMLGKRIGVRHAEGLLTTKVIGMENLSSVILNET